jgi:phosphatidylserine/phosphatidylglycerophosphate/cardiolipin synthase-like enzyme
MDIFFSPKGGCVDAIVKEITAAEKSVYVQAYTFTQEDIGSALIAAAARGLDVQVIMDKFNAGAQGSLFLPLKKKMKVVLDGKHRIAHNKVIIIDQSVVITGSFNFTEGAELYNAENMVVVRDAEVAQKYLGNWQEHFGHSDDKLRHSMDTMKSCAGQGFNDRSRLISIDFDGTIVSHHYPEIGEPLDQAFEVMKDLQAAGHRLILNTCREGEQLQEAIAYCRERGIEFVSVNGNRPEDDFREPVGRKVYAHLYIDDRNLGGFPGWEVVREMLM